MIESKLSCNVCIVYTVTLPFYNMSDNEHEKVFQAEKSFHIVDYCIFIAFIFISLSIGLWHAFSGGKQKTTHEFLLADGKLRILPASLSMLVCGNTN